uniref:protein phosphatase 1 regulatory subunit 42 isoform X2 n=1 Tax=Myxine glutinosa TaxID=7769 RepID=UPI00358E0522
MVQLTEELVARSNNPVKCKKGEDVPRYLRRITHLYFANRNIDCVVRQNEYQMGRHGGTASAALPRFQDGLSACHSLSVVYLYDNRLRKLPRFSFASQLTHLYLQNNQLYRMENLANLHNLTKLYLGGNFISVVEDLNGLKYLQELHVENQHLAPGEKLLFEPRSLQAVAMSLCVVNVSGNRLDNLVDLACLERLNHCITTNNLLHNVKDLAAVLACWPLLCRLDLVGNPLCQQAKFKDEIITATSKLGLLDGKEIKTTTREFLLNWKAHKEARKKGKHCSKFMLTTAVPAKQIDISSLTWPKIPGRTVPLQKSLSTPKPSFVRPKLLPVTCTFSAPLCTNKFS